MKQEALNSRISLSCYCFIAPTWTDTLLLEVIVGREEAEAFEPVNLFIGVTILSTQRHWGLDRTLGN